MRKLVSQNSIQELVDTRMLFGNLSRVYVFDIVGKEPLEVLVDDLGLHVNDYIWQFILIVRDKYQELLIVICVSE